MISPKDDRMGRVSVDVELANNDDVVLARLGAIPPEQVRRVRLNGVVDSGATSMVIPEKIAQQLGLTIVGRTKVRYADERVAERDVATGLHVSCCGRDDTFRAVVEPSRDSVLIGAIVLEALDLIVDCGKQQLVPRDPRYIISYAE